MGALRTGSLLVCALAVLTVLWRAPAPVDASHFAYGHLRWAIDDTYPQQTCNTNGFNGNANCVRILFTWQLAWRWGGSPWEWQPTPRPPVGSTNMRPGGPGYEQYSYSTPRGYNSGGLNLLMTCKSTSALENWFYGEMDSLLYMDRVLDNPVTLNHQSAARLIDILEGNGNQNWRIYTVINVGAGWGTRSPISTALPRVYAAKGKQIKFQLPAASFDGFSTAYDFAPLTDSLLQYARPCGVGGGGVPGSCSLNAPNTQMTLSSTRPGELSWTPQTAGLYSVQFKITSKDSGGVSRNSCPLDMIYQVDDCSTCPYCLITFNPIKDGDDPGHFNCYVGFQTHVTITATIVGTPQDARYVISMSNTPPPANVQLSTSCESGVYPNCRFELYFTRVLGQGSNFICFQANANDPSYTGSSGLPPLHAYGMTCLYLDEVEAQIIYMSGIIRDFKKDFPSANSFGVANNQNAWSIPGMTSFVATDLDNAGNPVYVPAVTPIVSFNDWWADVPASNKQMVYSVTLTNAKQSDPNVYNYYNGNFFPIDCKLWDAPELNGNVCPSGQNLHNKYFTYTIHTYTTYNADQVFTFKSSDDLWVFINGKLVTPTLQGTHAETTYQLNMNNQAAGLGISVGQTYRADIFFAHRSSTGTPSLQLQMPAAALCNSLSSPFVEFKLGITPANNVGPAHVAWNTAAGAGGNMRPTGAATTTNTLGTPPDNTNYPVFQLTSQSTPALSGGTGWYSVNGAPRAIKYANGFETVFQWRGRTMSGNPSGLCSGFAFVFQSASPTAVGGEAGNLEYAGIDHSVAVEFDANQDVTGLNDPSYQHISIHTLFDAQNSAVEAGPPGPQLGISSYDPVLPLGFCNDTIQTARIQYLPGQVNQSAPVGTPAYGWIRVWMNQNLVPTAEAQVDSIKLNAKLGTVAYVGFTTSVGYNTGGTATKALIDLHSWKMSTVPTAPALCSLNNIPGSTGAIVAGTASTVVIQARDACNNPIQVGGEDSSIVTSLQPIFGSQVFVAAPVTDNTGIGQPGKYTVTFTPTRAVKHALSILWSGEKTVPSSNNPYQFDVAPAATTAAQSLLMYSIFQTPGRTAGRLSNAPLSSLTTQQGVYLVIVSGANLAVLTQRTFDLNDAQERTDFTTAHSSAPSGAIVAMAWWSYDGAASDAANPLNHFSTTAGSCACANSVAIDPILTGIGAVPGNFKTNAYGATCCVQAKQYVVIGRKGAGAGSAAEASDPIFATTTLSGTTTAPPTIAYTVEASSGSSNVANTGKQVRINVLQTGTLTIKSGTTPILFVIRARDAFSNLAAQAGDEFRVSFNPPMEYLEASACSASATQFCASYDQNQIDLGHYYFSFYSSTSGLFNLAVTLGGTLIGAGASQSVLVLPGPASGLRSTASGGGLSGSVAGVPNTILLNLADVNGNAVIVAQGDIVTGKLVGPATYSPRNFTIVPDPNWTTGQLTMTYNVSKATGFGEYFRIEIRINGELLVATANTQVTITPGPISAPRCTHNLATSTIAAGVVSYFIIQTADRFGNPRLTNFDNVGSDSITVTVVNNGPGGQDVTGNQPITFVGLGQFQCTLSTVTFATQHTVTIVFNGVAIMGSPAVVTFSPGPASAPNSAIEASTFVTAPVNTGLGYISAPASATQTQTFYVLSADQFTNKRATPSDLAPPLAVAAFTPRCQLASSFPCTSFSTVLTAAPTGPAPNRYAVTWGSSVAGNYSVGITLASTGAHVSGSPYWVVVTPTATVPARSVVTGAGTGGAETTQVQFTVQTRDQFDNNQRAAVADTVTATQNSGSANPVCAKNAGTSLWTCTYLVSSSCPTTPGTYTVSVSVNSVFVASYTAQCVPLNGRFFVRNTTVLGLARAGTVYSFVVQDQTANGQPATPCGLPCVSAQFVKRGGDPNYIYSTGDGVSITQNLASPTFYTISVTFANKCSVPGCYDINGFYSVKLFNSGVLSNTTIYTIEVRSGTYSPTTALFNLQNPTAAVVSSSAVSIPGTAGTPVTLNVVLRDQFSQDILIQQTPTPILRIGTAAYTGTWVPGTHSYQFTYTILTVVLTNPVGFITGSLDMGVGNQAMPIVSVTVPNVLSAARSFAQGLGFVDGQPFAPNNGLTRATATVTAGFYIYARDAYNNSITPPDSTPVFTVADVTCVNGVQYVPPQAGGAANQYLCEYTPVTAGLTTITVRTTPGNVIIESGSPYSLLISPGDIDPSKCSLATPGGTQFNAGDDMWFTVTLKDSANNAWYLADDATSVGAIFATVQAVSPTKTVFPAPIDRTVVSPGQNLGVYRIQLSGTTVDPTSGVLQYPFTAMVGTYTWTVKVRPAFTDYVINLPSVVVQTVVAAGPAAEKAVMVDASGARITSVTIQVQSAAVSTYLQMYDRFSNIITVNSATIVPSFYAAGTSQSSFPICPTSTIDEIAGVGQTNGQLNPGNAFTAPSGTVTYQTLGRYQISLYASAVGNYYLNATIQGRPLACLAQQTQTIVVVPGAASGARSYITGLQVIPGASNVVGQTIEFNVTVLDALYNRRIADGTDIIRVGVNNAFADIDLRNAGFVVNGSTAQSTWLCGSTANCFYNVTVDPSHKYNVQNAPVEWLTSYHVSVYTTRAGTYSLVVSVNGELIIGSVNPAMHPSDPPLPYTMVQPTLVTLGAGPAYTWAPTGNLVATTAIPSSFRLSSVDFYGNPVTAFGSVTYIAKFIHIGGFGYDQPVPYQFFAVDVPQPDGTNLEQFLPAWSGDYSVQVTIHISTPNAVVLNQPAFLMTVAHATCAYMDATKPYRCPINRACVAAYTDCTDIPPAWVAPTCAIRCASDGSCQPANGICPCPSGQVRCAEGQCAASIDQCLLAADCPAGQVKCLLNGVPTGACRASMSDCPSPRVCPPGLLMCPDTTTCVSTSTDCPAPVVCPATYRTCPDNTCARLIEDCPTQKTCPGTEVVCPDGSCQASALFCPDVYKCYAPNPFRCADGSCRADSTSCPSGVACPIGSVLCENGQCALTASACGTPIECPRESVRCPGGSCASNLMFCPARTTCPVGTPVLCPDGSCTSSSFLCPPLAVCPAGTNACPDGACVANVQFCPTPKVCPDTAPVLCSDSSCQTTASKCLPTPKCPSATPVRCGDGSCRTNLIDCPSNSQCPASFPVRCFDGSCVISPGLCPSTVNYTCADGFIRCAGGECALAVSECPTHTTCLVGYYRCLDGSCRTDCTTINNGAVSLTCPAGQIKCPQANTGFLCASTLANCPQGLICPISEPVKCIDASCALTSASCPPPPTTYPDYELCADGTWSTGGAGSSSCARPPTCPPNAPYKCYDLTCRISAADCPIPPSCPLATPYLCPNGGCFDRLWSCKPYGQCDATGLSGAYVQCADPGHTCKADISLCPPYLTELTTVTDVCPYLWTPCKDGACKEQSLQCQDLTCPEYMPERCPNGLCVANSTQCPLLNGCPPDKPIHCWTGVCRESNAQCLQDFKTPPATICEGLGGYLCPDGSCSTGAASCPNSNGCATGQIRCVDGSCVNYIPGAATSACTSGTTTNNACPGNRPFRCTDGYCAMSSQVCPPPVVDPALYCSSDKPMLCASGECVAAAIQCPVILPCNKDLNEIRCGDGTCRLDGTCPCQQCADKARNYGSTCPVKDGVIPDLIRCSNGLCAPKAPDGMDKDTYCPNNSTGCPSTKPTKCDTGICIAEPSSFCFNFTRPSNGCPNSLPEKCVTTGECKATIDDCPLPNGCPISARYLCFADGTCHADPTECNAAVACENKSPKQVRCADGRCAATAAQCDTSNGCPATRPIRCANGDCAQFAAGSGKPDSCPVTIACADTTLTLCYSGACVSTKANCPPLPNCGAKFLCPDGTCAASQSACTSIGCPPGSPVLCANGLCAVSAIQCPNLGTSVTSTSGGNSRSGSSSACTSPRVVCYDGSCKDSWSGCTQFASDSYQGAQALQGNSNATGVCPGNAVLCADGSCVTTKFDCPIIPACDRYTSPLRCWDGSCVNTTTCPTADPGNCVAGYVRCEDGTCRAAQDCLPFDGCPLSKPYACVDRTCKETADRCPISLESYNAAKYGVQAKEFGILFAVSAANLNQSSLPAVPTEPSILEPQFIAYGDEFDGPLYWPCNTSCVADAKAVRQNTTISASATTTIDIAYSNGVAVSKLLIPSGSLLHVKANSTYNSLSSILIRPVAESYMAVAINNNPAGRNLEFVYAVVSPAFECSVEAEVAQPFPINLTYTSQIDSAPQLWGQAIGVQDNGRVDVLTQYLENVCLATPLYEPFIAAYVWHCLTFDTDARAAQPVRGKSSNAPPSQVNSSFAECGTSGTVYAFVFAPPYIVVPISDTASFVDKNIQWILLVIVGLGVFGTAVTYFGSRLYRYRAKLHKERKEVKGLQNEVDDMEQFGGRVRKDSDVHMVDNPMAIQLKEMQAKYDANEIKMRQAEAEERAALSAERQEAIRKMDEDRKMMSIELDKLKVQLEEQEALALQSKQKAMEQAAATDIAVQSAETAAATVSGAAVVRSEFTVAKPKRRQMSRNIE